MAPVVPPSVVLLFCHAPRSRVADRLCVSDMTLKRHIAKGWSGWRVGLAQRFCEIANVDFFNLTLRSGNAPLLKAFEGVDWSYTKARPLNVALSDLLRASGKPTTASAREALAREFAAKFNGAWGGSQNSPPSS